MQLQLFVGNLIFIFSKVVVWNVKENMWNLKQLLKLNPNETTCYLADSAR